METSLLNGCALVIDDEINDQNSNISLLISALEEAGTLFVKFSELPSQEAYKNLAGISFIILDWRLKKLDSPVQLGAELLKSAASDNISFIIEVLNRYFIPIFIFTDKPDEAKEHLSSDSSTKNFVEKRVIIKHKSELTGENVTQYLNEWLNSNKTILSLKMFEEKLVQSKNTFLVELGELSTDWVSYVYNTLRDDYKNESDQAELLNVEFNEFLLNSFTSRLELADFSSVDYASKTNPCISDEDIYKIYESIKFYKYNDSVNNKQAFEGDLYRKKHITEEPEIEEFFININAPCDLRSNNLLLVKGVLVNELYKVEQNKTKPVYELQLFMGKAAIQFKFRNIRYYKRPNNLSSIEIGNDTYERIGRITHPYITALRSEYAHFIARQGVPRHPDMTINTKGGINPEQRELVDIAK
jgi:hypothetical protein